MSELSTLIVKVADLAEALRLVVKMPRRSQGKRKPVLISLEFVPSEEALQIAEATHRTKVHRLSCSGSWSGRVQVDGVKLRTAIERYPSSTTIQLIAHPRELAIAFEKSVLKLQRADPGGSGGIDAAPIPRNPKHQGPVAVAPDPTSKRAELGDTWGFSARVPMPQHRDPKK